MICPPPLWIASECKVQSRRLTLTPLIDSSQRTPSLVTHYQPLSQESLISFMNWIPLVASTNTFGPTYTGPKFQSLVPATSLSHPNSSLINLALVLGSSLGVTFPFSMATLSSSYIGSPLAWILLCLFGDLDIHSLYDSAVTVSLKVTIGSLFIRSHLA